MLTLESMKEREGSFSTEQSCVELPIALLVFFRFSRCLYLPWNTCQPLQSCMTDALACASWTVSCSLVF